MTGFAFGLVFVAAFIHATWNLLAKRSSGGVAFVFLANVFAVLIYAPLVIPVLLVQQTQFDSTALIFIVGSAVIHIFYFLVLQRGYQVGDLSLVYPLARGTGPMLSSLVAIALLGERPTPLAVMGIACIIGGVFVLTGDPLKLWRSNSRTAVFYGVLTGALIATYTIWDKVAVSQFSISPILLNFGCNVFESILIAPFAWHYWQTVKAEWQQHRFEVLGVAALSPLAYILVLVAMVSTPVSHVAPIRELSILIGAIMGHRLLAEGEAAKRLAASGAIVVGIGLLASN
jgi:drug/metabolite transporter (DMT)-like permease